MNSTSPSDETPTEGPQLFQAPRPGPGRPSSTSTSEPPASSTPETNPNRSAESSTSPDQDWSTRSHPVDGEPRLESGTSSDSPGSDTTGEPTGLRKSIAAGIINATEAAYNAATDDVGRHLDQFRASDTEIMEISDAGARIITRKLPPGVGNRDFEDVVRVGMAVLSYVTRQFKIVREARAIRRKLQEKAGTQTTDQPA